MAGQDGLDGLVECLRCGWFTLLLSPPQPKENKDLIVQVAKLADTVTVSRFAEDVRLAEISL